MSSPTHARRPSEPSALPPLVEGERLDQPAFHQRYLAMPEGTHAELIGGVVFMHSPARFSHGGTHSLVNRWLGHYEDATPGTHASVEVSALLGPRSEPQPDCCLLILPAFGGQTTLRDDWLIGAPELVAEIALTSEAFDLDTKKADYLKAGVKEYVVVALKSRRVHWFAQRDEAFVERTPDADGLYRSEAFPGLWLDPAALLAGDMGRVRAALAAGLATPEHAAFVERLRSAKGRGPSEEGAR